MGGSGNVQRWSDQPVRSPCRHCDTRAAFFPLFFSFFFLNGDSVRKRGRQAPPSGASRTGQARNLLAALRVCRARLLGALQDFSGRGGLCPRRRRRLGSSRGLACPTRSLGGAPGTMASLQGAPAKDNRCGVLLGTGIQILTVIDSLLCLRHLEPLNSPPPYETEQNKQPFTTAV